MSLVDRYAALTALDERDKQREAARKSVGDEVRARVLEIGGEAPAPASVSCKLCGEPIEWHRTEAKGKRIPLDPGPIANGNVVVREGLVVVLKRGEEPAEGEARRRAHMASCAKWEGRQR